MENLDAMKGQPARPTVLIVFGATGDLMIRKIAPSLFHLWETDKLPPLFSILGVSRRDIDNDGFRALIEQAVSEHLGQQSSASEDFIKRFSYLKGRFENESDYKTLKRRLDGATHDAKTCANRLFYLAVSPKYYESILSRLASTSLTEDCGHEGGWKRVLIEKPFGKDIVEAQALDQLLGRLFKDEQVYRIDHYLAKEVLQNIIMFRFSNNLLEGVWNNKYIERINIRILEEIGVEGRGAFYEEVGALVDVGQNHLLQMLALATMEHPVVLSPETIRKAKEKLLGAVQVPGGQQITENTVRGQYEGYLEEPGIDPESQVETYFLIRTAIDSPRWSGVPIYLESGKKLPVSKKEIEVVFEHPAPCICPVGSGHMRNLVRFRIEPEPGIVIQFWSKKPGSKMALELKQLDFKYDGVQAEHSLEDYQKVLLDCIDGDQTLFSSSAESMNGWKFIAPIVRAWREDAVPLNRYRQDDQIFKTAKTVVMKEREYELKQEIGLVGLGKMGANLARRLIDKGWSVVGFNRTAQVTKDMESEDLRGAYSLKELVQKIEKPRVVWLMVPAGRALDQILFAEDGLLNYLEPGDIVIDGGNSFYKDTKERAVKLKQQGLELVDVGVSGGPRGARWGACLMVGGERRTFEHLFRLFVDISVSEGVRFFDGSGAGHFVKMVHNGIEYGMMQSIAEGFNIMKSSDFGIDLLGAADVYNHGSVIESSLIGWLRQAFLEDGADLTNVSSVVGHTGEAEWTVNTAKELHVKTEIIEGSLQIRKDSEQDRSYAGKVLTALRSQFGGHGKGENQ